MAKYDFSDLILPDPPGHNLYDKVFFLDGVTIIPAYIVGLVHEARPYRDYRKSTREVDIYKLSGSLSYHVMTEGNFDAQLDTPCPSNVRVIKKAASEVFKDKASLIQHLTEQ